MKWFKRKEWIYVGSYQCGYTSYDLYVWVNPKTGIAKYKHIKTGDILKLDITYWRK